MESDNIAGKYLTFTLAGEDYGIAILKVKEIIGMMAVTTVPKTPDFVRGVINLRGQVIPIVDLRAKFKLPEITVTDRTCIVVVDMMARSDTVQLGIIVDSVSEVMNIKTEEIVPAPSFGTKVNLDYILGMAKIDGGVKILLDINRVLSEGDISMLQTAA